MDAGSRIPILGQAALGLGINSLGTEILARIQRGTCEAVGALAAGYACREPGMLRRTGRGLRQRVWIGPPGSAGIVQDATRPGRGRAGGTTSRRARGACGSFKRAR